METKYLRLLKKWYNDSKKKEWQGINFLLGIFFFLVAHIYHNHQCGSGATLYLFCHGALLVASFVIRAQSASDVILPILGVIHFATVCTFSVLVFRGYSSWQHTLPEKAGFCYQVPYLTAFTFLMIFVVTGGIIAVVTIVMLICHVITALRKVPDPDPIDSGALASEA